MQFFLLASGIKVSNHISDIINYGHVREHYLNHGIITLLINLSLSISMLKLNLLMDLHRI
jgi:hypothetical protein